MARTKAERLAKVHSRALAEFDRIQEAQRDERKQCVQDRRFYSIAGAQWEDKLGEQFANRPKFEMNKVHLAVIRIINEYRNNRVSADFVPRDGASNLDLADICDGLYRADEQDSGGEEAYDNAFEEGVGGGFGAWRLRNEYEDEEDEENEHQRICFEPIYDADTSVFFDLDAKRQDKSDAKRAYVIYAMTPEAYEEEWNDSPASWPKEITDETYFDWNTPDYVYVAEYYEVEEVAQTIRYFLSPAQIEEIRVPEDQYEDMLPELEAQGAVEIRSRKVKTRKVHKYIMSGGSVLEDCGYIAGKHIPIIPFYGKRWYVDGIERCMGHVRLAKDAQRLKNMVISWLAEIAGESPTSKPIFAPEQVAGHEAAWRDDNIDRYPYLLANPLTDAEGNIVSAGPQAYTKAPEIPPAMAALLQILDIDLAEILGNAQEGDKMVSNISGKAVEMIQERLDRQAFIYLSNFAKSMRRSAQVWLSMAKEIYTEKGRKKKLIGEMGNIESIEFGREVIDEDTGTKRDMTDLNHADFDVSSDVGPSFQSRRDATVRGLTNLMQFADDPADRKILMSMVLMNTEGEGLGEINEYYRKQLVAQGVVPPNDEERKAMEEAAAQPAEPSPQDKYLMAEAMNSEADAMKKAAETDEVVAKTANIEADTAKKEAETLAELGGIGLGAPA